MRRSGLFLIELVLVILFFAMTSAVCMKVFATSKLATDEGKWLDLASSSAEEAAERFKSVDGDIAAAAALYGVEAADGDSFTAELGGGITLRLARDAERSGKYATFCDITVSYSGGEIISITAAALTD